MGTLLSRVAQIGQDAGNMGRRAMQAPGNLMNRGLDKLEASTYNHLMSNAGERAERIAQNTYRAKFNQPVGIEDRMSVLNALQDNEFARLQDRARGQAALVPGGMRAAGRVAKSPLAMTAYGVGGTLAVGNMLEEQGQREQLIAMGLTPEEAEILANEVAMAAQNMEPLPVF